MSTVYILGLVSVLYLITLFVIYRLVSYISVVKYNECYYRILNTCITHAYALIYKNHIVALLANNVKPTNEDVNRLRVMFVDLVKRSAGPNVIKKLSQLHGSVSALETFLILTFDELLDKDLTQE